MKFTLPIKNLYIYAILLIPLYGISKLVLPPSLSEFSLLFFLGAEFSVAYLWIVTMISSIRSVSARE
jgi:hypothetical protein